MLDSGGDSDDHLNIISRTLRNQLKYKIILLPAQIGSRRQTELMLWSAYGGARALTLGECHNIAMSRLYLKYLSKVHFDL